MSGMLYVKRFFTLKRRFVRVIFSGSVFTS